MIILWPSVSIAKCQYIDDVISNNCRLLYRYRSIDPILSVECACLEGFLALDLDLDLFTGCQPKTGLLLFSGLRGFNFSTFIK